MLGLQYVCAPLPHTAHDTMAFLRVVFSLLSLASLCVAAFVGCPSASLARHSVRVLIMISIRTNMNTTDEMLVVVMTRIQQFASVHVVCCDVKGALHLLLYREQGAADAYLVNSAQWTDEYSALVTPACAFASAASIWLFV